MALSLVLRNAARLQGAPLSQNILKLAPSATNTNSLSWVQCPNYSVCVKKTLPVVTPQTSKRNLSLSQPRLSAAGDHSKLWVVEKAISAGLLVLLPAAIAVPNPVFDNVLAVAVVSHFHWGLIACAEDYVRPLIFGNLLPKVALALVYAISATTLGGLIYYNVHSIGIGKTVREIWAIKPKQQ